MAASSKTAGQSKYGPHNAFDGLRVALPSAASDQQVFPTVNAFDGLRIAPPTPASISSTASSSGTKHLPYDVFINHHGGDSKHTVADAIYKSLNATGLRVFLDKDELILGDFFPKTLEEAMRSSSLHIAIFSQHYAESPWCLAELEFMVKTGNKIIPVFYHIEPSTLRWAIQGKGIYSDAFSNYEKKRRYSSEQLQQWKWALHEASFFIGDIINNQEDEQRVVKNVVNGVMKEMNKVPLEVAKHPVGIDEAVQNFETIALQSGDSIQIVGIWGMGGSGKTTLAKKIFNDRRSAMDRSSFLSDLRDAAGKGLLVQKQKKLLEDLDFKGKSFDNVDEGKGILENRLRSVSVLIILDDVDHTDQLDALLPTRERLGHGSLIVVTTRELDVLKAWGISAIYQMKPLNAIHAKQLFCWHSFLQPSPQSEFEDLVEEFLNACKGLPLSLKVIGAQLYGRPRKDYWQSLLDKLSRIMPNDIKSRLKVSYDALDDEEKEMFLDTACFFIGQRKNVAIAVWEGSGWSGLHGWERLFNKCLIEVEDGGAIRMHDHLRDLGREIANRQSPFRLWSPQQSIQIHSQQEAIQIRGLVNAFGENCYLRQGNIIIHTSLGERNLPLASLGLKIFVGNGDFIDQEHSEISRELVWLQCNEFRHINFPSWLSLKKLRILELFSTWSLERLWEDADAPLQLRELVMQNCDSLRQFPRSIGQLKNFKKIIISNGVFNWYTLSTLPQEFCHLQSLEHLVIKGCRNLSSLPSNFGKLRNLQHLTLNGCTSLKMLPDSFKRLTLLEHLNLAGCGELIIKSELHVLENMTKLRYLYLNECRKLEELSLPKVASLKELYLEGTSLKELPANIFQLTKLTELVIGSEFLQTLPSSLGNLYSLNKLEIHECKKLEALSDSLEHLNSLKDLVIKQSGVKCLPKSFIYLQRLVIKNTPITELSFGLGCMLREMDLEGTEVSRISVSGDSCPFLETLRLASNEYLRNIETLPATLKTINVWQCNALKDIRGLRGLKNLEKLQIQNCKELDELPSLGEFTSLKTFKLQKCNKLEKIESFECLKSLEELNISDCPGLEALPNLSEITSLKEIQLNICLKLKRMEGLQGLRSLKTLNISDCPELDRLPSLSEISSLKEIQLKKCHKLEKIEDFQGLKSLETLIISDCPELGRFPSLEELTYLKEIQLNKCHKLEMIEGLQGVRSLETLDIHDCPKLGRLPSLEELISLTKLDLSMCHRLEKVEGLENLRSLDKLKISDCPEVEVLPSLSFSLKEIILKKCYKLKRIEGLENLRSLNILNINDCPELDGLPSLSEITSLKEIQLNKCQKLKKIKGFQGLRSLKTLDISDCPELNRLPSLEELTSLQIIELRMCHKLEKLEGLERLRSLVKLEMHSCWNVPCIVNLENCEILKRLVVVTKDRSDIEPYINNIQKWPRDVMICTRAVFDVGSLKKCFELPNLSVLRYSVIEKESDGIVELRRPESSANANAILICFIIDCDYPYLNFYIFGTTDFVRTELDRGKWVWMGVFTQGSRWLRSEREIILGERENDSMAIVKVEEAWLVMGEEGTMVKAFHQIFQR